MALEEKPFVSVIIPAWNEEKYIGMCLESLLDQDYLDNMYEIIVIDDNSEDETAKIVKEISEKYPNKIRFFNNRTPHPRGESPEVRRTGIKHAKGEIIINFSAHVQVPSNYISALITTLMNCGNKVASVCGRLQTHPRSSLIAKSFLIAFSSFFGGAGTAQTFPRKDGFVDQVTFAAYRRSVIDEIGGYPLGGDSELNFLINRVGYKQYFTTKTNVYYYWRPRGAEPIFLAFLKRMFSYGAARMSMIKKYPASLKIVYAMPSVLVLLLILALIEHIFVPDSFITTLLIILAGAYFIAAIISSIVVSSRNKYFRIIPFVFISYLIIHLAYGIGFIYGVFKS